MNFRLRSISCNVTPADSDRTTSGHNPDYRGIWWRCLKLNATALRPVVASTLADSSHSVAVLDGSAEVVIVDVRSRGLLVSARDNTIPRLFNLVGHKSVT